MTTPVRIAQLSCGPEYSGVQKEIDQAAKAVDAEIFYPDISLADIKRDFTAFGLDVRSPDLKLAIARAKALVEGRVEADAVFIATCFRCAEAAIVRNELRRYIHENSKLPVVRLFVHRTYHLGDLTHADGSPDHHRTTESTACEGDPGRAHAWAGFRFQYHEGRGDEG